MGTAVEVAETEQQLISSARTAISSCNWTVGECAAKWTERFARGRTDADFGEQVGLSGDQIYQRRRVWETFADVRDDYPKLKWSHFYVALTWNDSSECLAWAEENEATVAEMRAWRRMQHGEDLTVEAEADLDRTAEGLGFGEPILERVPEHFGESDGGRGTFDTLEESQASGNRVDVVSGEADAAAGPDAGYAPFRKDAGSPPPGESGDAHSKAPKLSVEQSVKRMTAALERCERLATGEVIEGFEKLPEKVRIRFITALENLNAKVADLS